MFKTTTEQKWFEQLNEKKLSTFDIKKNKVSIQNWLEAVTESDETNHKNSNWRFACIYSRKRTKSIEIDLKQDEDVNIKMDTKYSSGQIEKSLCI